MKSYSHLIAYVPPSHDWLMVMQKTHVYSHISHTSMVADAYLVRMKKQEAARAARAVMKLRRPAPVYRQNSMPPTSTATADPPEKAAEICNHNGVANTLLDPTKCSSKISNMQPCWCQYPLLTSLGQQRFVCNNNTTCYIEITLFWAFC